MIGDGENPAMDVMKLMVVSLAGWINQQQEDVIDQRTGSSSRSSDQRWKGRGPAASGLEDCFGTTTGMLHEIDDSNFWTLRDRNLLLLTKLLPAQSAPVALPQQPDNLFWFTSLLFHRLRTWLSKSSHSSWTSPIGGGQWHENGQKEAEGTYKDGQPHGLMMAWHGNGKKAYEVTYKDGMPDGLITAWHENGQKREEVTYEDRKLVSVKSWNKKGDEVDPPKAMLEKLRDAESIIESLK